jgi:Type IV secretion-system coupling protein DNA-binding domain
MATQWGRKETVIWPPHTPIYTYGAVFMAVALMFACVWCRFTFGTSPLMQAYTPTYLKSWVTGGLSATRQDKYRLLFVADRKRTAHAAMDADVVHGKTLQADGKVLPLALSDNARRQGLTGIFRGVEQSYNDAALYAYLKGSIFAGQSLWDIYYLPVLFGALAVLVQLPFSVKRDIARRKEMKYGRRLRGPERLTPKQFNKKVQGHGLGIKVDGLKEMVRIPARAEPQHIQIIADTGAGKTTIIMQYLRQIRARGDAAIVYDPAMEFIKRFYDESRHDVILNPLDKRCPYWGPCEELRSGSEADALAASLFQPPEDKKGEFFTEIPQQIFAHLLRFGPTPKQLIGWLSNPKEIDKRVEGTEVANFLYNAAGPQRGGVLGSLSKVGKSLRLLPAKDEGNGEWTATDWSEHRTGWIFLTSKPPVREALRPLHSVWIDMLVLRLLNEPKPKQKRVWFVIDELASLHRLPQLHTAITENRKSNNPVILGFQGKAQLEVIYGHLAEVMLSQPATSIYLKTKEPRAGKWVSEAIGQIEIERMKETHFDGTRAGRNFTLDRQIEPLVMESEISGLEDLHAYMKYGNYVTNFSFPYLDISGNQETFDPRILKGDKLIFDPKNVTGAAALPSSVPAGPQVDMDQDPEPEATPTEEELVASADPDAPEDSIEVDELDEDKELTQPSFHFDRA